MKTTVPSSTRARSPSSVSPSLRFRRAILRGLFRPDSEFNAGGIDPLTISPAIPRNRRGARTCCVGNFTEIAAYAKGKPAGYLSIPVLAGASRDDELCRAERQGAPSPATFPRGRRQIDPLRVTGPGTDFRQQAGNPVPVPMVYNSTRRRRRSVRAAGDVQGAPRLQQDVFWRRCRSISSGTSSRSRRIATPRPVRRSPDVGLPARRREVPVTRRTWNAKR